jgi:hypothetical protein
MDLEWGMLVTHDKEISNYYVRKRLRQQSKDFYAAGFDLLEKRCDKYICWWWIYREVNVFTAF